MPVYLLALSPMFLALEPVSFPTQLPTRPAPQQVAVLDLDRDGRPDLAVAVARGITLFRNEGGLRFRESAHIPLTRDPTELTTGDLNGDGITDLAAADHNTYAVSTFLGNGRGHLAPPATFRARRTGRPHVHGLLAGDFANRDRASLLLGSVEEGLLLPCCPEPEATAAAARSIKVGSVQNPLASDLDNDGFLDVVIAEIHQARVTIQWGGREGWGATTAVAVPARPYHLAVGDLNRDGQLDLVVTHDDIAEVSILWAAGRRTYRRESQQFAVPAYGVVIADTDGDSWPEVIGAGGRSLAELRFRSGRWESRVLPVEGGPGDGGIRAWLVRAADLNGDGAAELILPETRMDRVRILPGTPAPRR